jgi:hypothetical protein
MPFFPIAGHFAFVFPRGAGMSALARRVEEANRAGRSEMSLAERKLLSGGLCGQIPSAP